MKGKQLALAILATISPIPCGLAIIAAAAVSNDAARIAVIVSVVVITALCALSMRAVFRPSAA